VKPAESKETESVKLDVTAAVTFRGILYGEEDIFFTYSHFNPASKGSIDRCVEWINNYVKGRYQGKVLTDFDETTPHFEDAIFPLTKLMDPKISPAAIQRLLDRIKESDI